MFDNELIMMQFYGLAISSLLFNFLSIITLPHVSSHKEVSLQWKLASSWVMPSPGGGPMQL